LFSAPQGFFKTMFPGPGPPGLQNLESGRPVDLDTLLEGTGVIDMVNDMAASGLPGPGIQILNGCSDLAHVFLLGTLTTYITGLAGLSPSTIPGPPGGGGPAAVEATYSYIPALAAGSPVPCPPLMYSPTGGSTHSQIPVLATVPPFLSPPLAVSPTGACPVALDGPSRGAQDDGASEAVGAPIHFQSPALAAAAPTLAPHLTGSSSGPSPGAPVGGPLRLWEPLPVYPPPNQTPPIPQFTVPVPVIWLFPPLGLALGALRGRLLLLWEPLSTSRVQSWQQHFPS